MSLTEEEEEDHELRDLVTNVLDANGILPKIKVYKRSTLFQIILRLGGG